VSTLKVNEIRHLDNGATANVVMNQQGDVTISGDLTVPNATVSTTLTAGTVNCTTLSSSVTTGTAPFTVQSSTQVTNLNASTVQAKEPGTTDGKIPLLGAPSSANLAPAAGTLSTEFLAKAVPAGDLVGTTATQTLSNKTHSGAFTVSGGALTVSGSGAAINCTGDITAFSTSDVRLKKNIRAISPNALSSVSKLEGVRFEWLKEHDPDESTSVGVIAQQVREVLPEAVTSREDGTLAVRYELIIPLLIEAIKQLDREVLRLQQEVHGGP